jgi:hypothetical protein
MWDETHEGGSHDPDRFIREVLPVIQVIPVRKLAAATGLSALYCSQIRRRLRVPHPRHWEALQAVPMSGAKERPPYPHDR